MKQATIIIASLVCLLFSACNVSTGGDIDGLWYLTKLDSIQSGTSRPMRDEMISWSFQSKFVQVVNYKTEDWRSIIMMQFTHNDNQLELSDPFIYNRLDGDILLTPDSIYLLRPYGINDLNSTFKVEKLNSKTMCISDDILRLHFQKY